MHSEGTFVPRPSSDDQYQFVDVLCVVCTVAVLAVCCRFLHCTDYTTDDAPTVTYQLVLRRWHDVHPGLEFRCFVRNHRLVGRWLLILYKLHLQSVQYTNTHARKHARAHARVRALLSIFWWKISKVRNLLGDYILIYMCIVFFYLIFYFYRHYTETSQLFLSVYRPTKRVHLEWHTGVFCHQDLWEFSWLAM